MRNPREPALSVVLPAYNESEAVGPLLDELRKVLDAHGEPYEVLVVDDGSTDGMDEVLRDRQADFPELRVVRFKKNAGQTAAMIAGLRLARGGKIVTMDADGQNDPADIPLLVARLEDHPAAFGIRVKRNDAAPRRFASWFANGVRNRLLGTNLRDTGCSLKAFRREAVPELPPFKGMHRFVPSFTMMKGYKGLEVPVNHRPRTRGVSKYPNFGRAIPALLDCLMVRRIQRNLIRYEIEEDR